MRGVWRVLLSDCFVVLCSIGRFQDALQNLLQTGVEDIQFGNEFLVPLLQTLEFFAGNQVIHSELIAAGP